MNIDTRSLYRQARARWFGNTASDALRMARRHIAGPLAEYESAMAAWRAQPDKRRYAPGGSEARPKFPTLYSAQPEPSEISGLRDCGYVDKLFPRMADHQGYYADDHCDVIYRGQVWQLPARNGQCVYVAGYLEPCSGYPVLARNDGGTIELFTGDKDEALKDAARAADHLAERNAEREREYSERWSEASNANQDRETAREELKGARHDARMVIAAMRELKDGQSGIAELLAERLERARDEMRAAIESIAEHAARIAELDMEGEF